MSIELRVWPFDYSHPAAEGELTDYYNAGWRCELIVDGRVYALSRARDYPEEVNLYGTRLVPTPTSSSADSDDFAEVQRILGGIPYNDPIFVKAARWLLDQPGIEQLRVFTQDPELSGISFVPVDPQRLTEPGRTAAIQRRRLLTESKFTSVNDDTFNMRAAIKPDTHPAYANITSVDDDTFGAEVLGSSNPVLVNFHQLHNPGSEALTPVLERIAAAHGQNLTIVMLDVDENPTVTLEQEISSIPTAVVYVDGQPVKRIEGSWTEPGIHADLADYL